MPSGPKFYSWSRIHDTLCSILCLITDSPPALALYLQPHGIVLKITPHARIYASIPLDNGNYQYSRHTLDNWKVSLLQEIFQWKEPLNFLNSFWENLTSIIQYRKKSVKKNICNLYCILHIFLCIYNYCVQAYFLFSLHLLLWLIFWWNKKENNFNL